MTRRGRSILALSALALLVPRGVAGDEAAAANEVRAPDEVGALLSRLDRRSSRIQTLEARFVQRKRLAAFETEIITRGLLLYRRPDRIRWETEAPDASVVILRGQQAELRLPGEPARRLALGDGPQPGRRLFDLLAWVGVGRRSALRERYAITTHRKGDWRILRLRPKQAGRQTGVVEVRLRLDAKMDTRAITIVEADGDQTVIELADLRANRPLPPGSFR